MKKRCSLLTIAGILFYSAGYAQTNPGGPTEPEQPASIEWLTWDEAMTRMDTASEKKKVFIDIYTDWCGWCKKMDKTTFVDPAVISAMNESYYAVKLDAEMKEKVLYNSHEFVNPQPDGKRSVHQLAGSLLDWQMSYPSYVILDEKRIRLTLFKGYKQVPDMFSILNFFGRNHYQYHNNFLYKQWEQQLKLQQQLQEQQNAQPENVQSPTKLQD